MKLICGNFVFFNGFDILFKNLNYNKLDKKILNFCHNLSQIESQKLAFKKQLFPEVSNQWLVNQFLALQGGRDKLPEFFSNEQYVFPDKMAVEQATSAWVAKWKAGLIPDGLDLLIDGTAGMGVDSYYLGKRCNRLLAFESSDERAQLLRHNLMVLGLTDFNVMHADFQANLDQLPISIPDKTMVYLDPDRRPNEKRVVSWLDSKPDLRVVYDFCRKKQISLMVKFSPMDNPMEIPAQLPGLSKIWIVSLHQEVKEVLVQWNFSKPVLEPAYSVVEIQRSGIFNETKVPLLNQGFSSLALPEKGSVLYDPWPVLRKNFMAQKWMLNRNMGLLSPEAQFFTHKDQIEDFPCRAFQILDVVENLTSFSKSRKNKSLHVICRNFPVSADDIKSKNKWVEGGDQYLFCYQNPDKKSTYILTQRLENRYSETFWQKI